MKRKRDRQIIKAFYTAGFEHLMLGSGMFLFRLHFSREAEPSKAAPHTFGKGDRWIVAEGFCGFRVRYFPAALL